MSEVDMIRETIAYETFLNTGKKHINEAEYNKIVSDSVREAFDDVPGAYTGFNAAMGWWHTKRQSVKQALTSDGITVHYNDEYETMFKEWYDKQDLPVVNGPLHALKVYSEKRQEFDEIYKKEKQCWDSKNI